jgi:hypothetical protein
MTLISNSPNYTLVPIDADVVLATATVDDVPELHDRILVGTAKHLNLSKNRRIFRHGLKMTVK